MKAIPGAADVGLSTRGQKPELEVTVDRALAASLGLTVAQVAQSLRPSFAGVDAGDWVDPTGKTRDVEVRLAAEERVSHGDVEDLPLVVSSQANPSMASATSPSISTVPLRQIALIAGMIPVAIGAGEGADFRAPLGRAVIGGTVTSTMLTLLVIPTLYEIMSDLRGWIGRRFVHPSPRASRDPLPGGEG